MYYEMSELSKQLKDLVGKYEDLISSNEFYEKMREAAELSFQIWHTIAKLSNFTLEPVEIKESIAKVLEFSYPNYLELAKIGGEIFVEGKTIKISVREETGYAIFVDFTRSTEYFGIEFRENYTGPIIFYSYNMVLKDYLKYSGGEFLENTGDGAFIFTENLSVNDILTMLYLAEVIRSEAEKADLLVMDKCISPIHIGVSYGEGHMVKWNMEKKFISSATWEAAKNCKEAPRRYEPCVLFKSLAILHGFGNNAAAIATIAQNIVKTRIIDNNLKLSFIVDIFDDPIELELPVKTSVNIL